MEFTNPLVYGVPVFIALILLELAYSKTSGDHHLYHWKDLAVSGFMGLGSAILAPLFKTLVAIVFFEMAFEICNPVVDGVRRNILGHESFGYAWYIWVLCQLADDLSYYWFHRANHEVRILWAAHVVHHSSKHFNFGTAVRNGWFTILYKPLFYVWMPIIGFPPEMVVVCLGIEALWQFQLHTLYVPKWGFLELIFNTHTMHQVHHAQNEDYLDKNHGGILNVFDRLFGTWKPLDESIEVQFGVVHAPETFNPVEVLTHEFKDIWNDVKKVDKWSHKMMYVFGPPGWSHDGSSLTLRQQRRLQRENKDD